jgi:hypothetical protein
MNHSIQITPAAHGGKRSAWNDPRVAPVTHGTITGFSRDGRRALVENAAGDGIYIDSEPGYVLGLEITVPQVGQ